TAVRELDAFGHRIEPNAFAIAPDGTPIVSGVAEGRVAIARGSAAGTWDIQKSDIPAIVAEHVAISDGAIWTLSLGAGPDGKDRVVVAKDGAPVEVVDPDGKPLVPFDLAHDAQLGVV